MKSLTKHNNCMVAKFNSLEPQEFYPILEFTKALPGRKWNAGTQAWELPISEKSIEAFSSMGFDIDPVLKTYIVKTIQKKAAVKITLPKHLDSILHPYQKEGVRMIEQFNGRALLADEMGLGKTIQSISWLTIHPEISPALIVVPATLKTNWQREFEKWAGISAYVLYGKNNDAAYKNEKYVIVNYDILEAHQVKLIEMNFQALILDECHYLKNKSAKRTKALKEIAKNIPNIIAMSGTPITNRPIEFFSTLNILRPDVWASEWSYAQKFCGASHNGFGWDFKGSSNTEELHEQLKEYAMIRRLKKDVLTDLPPKQRAFVPMELSNRKTYDYAEAELIEWIKGEWGEEAAARARSAEQIVRIEKLKQLAVNGKMSAITEWIDNFLESGEKLILCVTHHETSDILFKKYKDISVKLDGRDSAEEKQKAVDMFQNSPGVKIFIGGLKAAGVGITLTAASNVAFIELGWTPGEHNQFEDRAHRIGQTDSVNIWYLVAEKTIEEEIVVLLDEKRKVLDSILDGQDSDEESLITELIKRYRER